MSCISGFVTYVLWRIFPEWKVQSTFISKALTSALSLDAKLSSHPIEVECPDANMINQVRKPHTKSLHSSTQ